MRKYLALVLLPLLMTGCTSLNSAQRGELAALKEQGAYVEAKSPGGAAALGLLPGGGSFYTRQWGWGICDLLLWPLSILWDPINGHGGAEVINYEESVANATRKGVSVAKKS